MQSCIVNQKRKTPQNNNVQEHKMREAGDGER